MLAFKNLKFVQILSPPSNRRNSASLTDCGKKEQKK